MDVVEDQDKGPVGGGLADEGGRGVEQTEAFLIGRMGERAGVECDEAAQLGSEVPQLVSAAGGRRVPGDCGPWVPGADSRVHRVTARDERKGAEDLDPGPEGGGFLALQHYPRAPVGAPAPRCRRAAGQVGSCRCGFAAHHVELASTGQSFAQAPPKLAELHSRPM